MELPQSNTQTPVYSYTCTELLSIRRRHPCLAIPLSIASWILTLDIIFHAVIVQVEVKKRKKQNLHSLIVASFNAQSVKANDMACKRYEISTFITDNGVDLFFVTETWLSAQDDKAKTVELAPSGFDVK